MTHRVLAYLEDRRVLYSPYRLEVEDQCISSVLDIRRFLTDVIGGLAENSKLAEHLRAIRAFCRVFLDQNSHSAGPHRGARWAMMGPGDSSFFTALDELRATIGLHVAALAAIHGLDVEGEFASVLPAGVAKDDA